MDPREGLGKPDLSYLYVFGALCYPTNNSEDLGKLKPKADIRIFVGYAPAKKAFLIYNKRTRLIIDTIHVNFDELIVMASEQFSSGPGPQLMSPGTLSLGLFLNPPPSVISLVHVAAAPRPVDQIGSPVSTLIDEDAPSTSNPSTQEQAQSLIISQGVEESPKTPHFHDDPLHETLHEDSTFQGSSFNVRPSLIEPKNFKEALLKSSWIDLPIAREYIEVSSDFCEGYSSGGRIDFEELFAPVARIEAIRIFIANALSTRNMETIPKMDVSNRLFDMANFAKWSISNFLIEKLGMKSMSPETLKNLAEEEEE
ncbi:retrovirus-related pol polyprotein from transposon TNT 1-94 [Tanacetum coccineum]|uniref:Retrovirus-related pol polyprotein from transposon TNT 1-94 n=1 Tax=Tanacetum coccineum TaxID=301880 RepID=A0ABQ5CG25_9ASTR